MSKQPTTLFFPLLYGLLLSSCCISSLDLKPHVTLDASGKLSGAEFGVIVNFDHGDRLCGKNKRQALRIQAMLEEQYRRFLAGEITLDQYNQYQKEAEELIRTIRGVLSATPEGKPITMQDLNRSGLDYRFVVFVESRRGLTAEEPLTRGQLLQLAWEYAEARLGALEAAMG